MFEPRTGLLSRVSLNRSTDDRFRFGGFLLLSPPNGWWVTSGGRPLRHSRKSRGCHLVQPLDGRLLQTQTRIIRVMTRALDTAIARITTLPPDEQDRIAQWLLDELNDEDRWTEQFANSRDSLSRLADEAVVSVKPAKQRNSIPASCEIASNAPFPGCLPRIAAREHWTLSSTTSSRSSKCRILSLLIPDEFPTIRRR